MGRALFQRSLILSLMTVLTAVACGTSSTQNAGSVKLLGQWSGQEQASLFAVLKPFTDRTGIKISYTSTRDEDSVLTSSVTAGNPPDMAAAPSPQLLVNFAKQGKVVKLNDIINMSDYQSTSSAAWIKLGEPLNDGNLYQTFSWASAKGFIWYNPKVFQSKGYSIPTSWDQLMSLQSQMSSSGTKPWCLTVESGAATGWMASDWLKEIVLSQAGPDVYDKWVAGTQKWSSPEIKQAWQTFGQMLGPNDSNVYGGASYIVATNFGDVGTPMFQSPPKCFMLNQASFITTFFTSANPSLQPVTDFNFFPLPDINSQYTGARVVSADAWSMFRDTPQARQLMQYLITADAEAIWVKRGGKLAVNNKVPLSDYPDKLSQQLAQAVTSAKIVKYDATDNMPSDMRAAAWADLVKFIQNQNQLDSLLAHLDSVQASAYKS